MSSIGLRPYINDKGLKAIKVEKSDFQKLLNNELINAEDESVTTIPSYSFYEKTSLQKANFPNLTKINQNSFQNCSNLETINASNVTEIGNGAFQGCSKLQSINFPKITAIKDNSFYGCSSLETINIPNITTIGASSFRGCSHLSENLSLPKVVSIGGYAFYGCSSLKVVSMESLERISSYIFEKAPLTNLYVPKLKHIEYSFIQQAQIKRLNLPAIEECLGYPVYRSLRHDSNTLEIVDLGENIKTLSYAFGPAPKMSTLIIRAKEIPTLTQGSQDFGGTPFASNGTGGTLYVPQALIEDYKAATNWSVILAYPNNQILPIEGSEYEIMEEGDN